MLEEDGIQCFDLEMLQSDAQDDLRLSIGAQTKEMPPPTQKGRNSTEAPRQAASSPESELLSKLERSRHEYDELKIQKEKLERSQQEQHLHTTIEMRESIELLNEESLIKNELLAKYEKDHEKMEEEVSLRDPFAQVSFYFSLCLQSFNFISIDQILQGPERRAHETPRRV